MKEGGGQERERAASPLLRRGDALMRTARDNRLTQPVPGIQVEILDIDSNITTVYDSVRKAALAINSDIKTILLVKN